MASIAFPSSLPIPLTDQFSETLDSSVTACSFDSGRSRVRRRTSTPQRTFQLVLELSDTEYLEFDRWYISSISNGSAEFDIRLVDSYSEPVWFTVRSADSPVVRKLSTGWSLSWSLINTSSAFYNRDPGTSNLQSSTLLEISASADLSVGYLLYAKPELEFISRATLSISLHGSVTISTSASANMPENLFGNVIIEFIGSAS